LPQPSDTVRERLIGVYLNRRRTCGCVGRIDSYVSAYIDHDITDLEFIARGVVNLPNPDLIE